MTWYCYIIRSKNLKYKNFTYNGMTNNLIKRLKQHNGIIKGGAKSTQNKGPFEYYMILTGFENINETLSCEWKIKHPTNKKLRPKIYNGIEGRIQSLNYILSLNKWTNNSIGLDSNKHYILYLSNDVIDIIDTNKIFKNIEIKKIENFDILKVPI